jgi:hypothetical protein
MTFLPDSARTFDDRHGYYPLQFRFCNSNGAKPRKSAHWATKHARLPKCFPTPQCIRPPSMTHKPHNSQKRLRPHLLSSPRRTRLRAPACYVPQPLLEWSHSMNACMSVSHATSPYPAFRFQPPPPYREGRFLIFYLPSQSLSRAPFLVISSCRGTRTELFRFLIAGLTLCFLHVWGLFPFPRLERGKENEGILRMWGDEMYLTRALRMRWEEG